jgi:hypothetical protein
MSTTVNAWNAVQILLIIRIFGGRKKKSKKQTLSARGKERKRRQGSPECSTFHDQEEQRMELFAGVGRTHVGRVVVVSSGRACVIGDVTLLMDVPSMVNFSESGDGACDFCAAGTRWGIEEGREINLPGDLRGLPLRVEALRGGEEAREGRPELAGALVPDRAGGSFRTG